jgi:large repetitive protein
LIRSDASNAVVTERRYDAVDQVIAEVVYGKSIVYVATASSAQVATAITAAQGDVAINQRLTRYVYDARGQVRFTLDDAGAVTEQRYNAVGQVVESRRYGVLANLSGNPTEAQVSAAVNPLVKPIWETSFDNNSLTGFEVSNPPPRMDNGRIAFDRVITASAVYPKVDGAQWHTLSENITYRVEVSTSADLSNATTLIALTNDATNASTPSWQRFGMSFNNGTIYAHCVENGVVSDTVIGTLKANTTYVTEIVTSDVGLTLYVYEKGKDRSSGFTASRSVNSASYGATRILMHGYSDATTAGGTIYVDNYSETRRGDVRVESLNYDNAGRLIRKVDGFGQVETYAYDAVGQRISMTNKLGYTWYYDYDADGRMVAERSPAVNVSRFDASGNVVNELRSIITRTAYDAMDNVVSRSENADTAETRTTRYQYDSRGNQIKTIFPDAYRIDEATNQLVALGSTPTTEITYNALNQAVVQKDVRGNYTYKVYDTLGRVAFDVDAEGYVTGYSYNSYDEQTSLSRYATKLNTAGMAGWVAGNAITAAQINTAGVLSTSANDRVLTANFDLRGQKVSVIQTALSYVHSNGQVLSGSPQTQFEFDAYGRVVKESVLLELANNGSADVWVNTFHYYDELGRKIMSVDAEGYVTTWAYNALGEITESTEYARAISTTLLTTITKPTTPFAGDATLGLDRKMFYVYDALGRKVSDTTARRFQNADGTIGYRDVTNTTAYDAQDRVTASTVDSGKSFAATTTTAYDALGRITNVIEPRRQVLASNAESILLSATTNDLNSAGLYINLTPFTSMAYDAFGNVIQVRRHASGSSVIDATNDSVQTTRYDRQGRAVFERNAEGQVIYRNYDAADSLSSVAYWLNGNDGRSTKVVSTFSYDKTGRQLASETIRYLHQTTNGTITYLAGQDARDTGESVVYNAFAEIVEKRYTGIIGVQQFVYDAAGRMTSSNVESGAWRNLGYNLAGHQVFASQKVRTDTAVTQDAITRQEVDRLGRAVRIVLPSNTVNSADAYAVQQRFDRWGNVIEMIDARGYQTTQQYNQLNQMISQTQPLVKVVSETGAESLQRPVLRWFYDVLGRQVGSQNANGVIEKIYLDAVGRVINTTDGNNHQTFQAYDTFGRNRFTQDALRYITFREFDKQDRVVSQGDYVANNAGTVRLKTVLEAYVLNGSGDRLKTIADPNGFNYIAKYEYDSRAQVVRRESAAGVVMEYAFDAMGKKVRETYNLSHGNFTDRESEIVRLNELTWDYDAFGHLIDHNDLSGQDYNYSYDALTGDMVSDDNSWNTTTTLPGGVEAGAPQGWNPTATTAQRNMLYTINGRLRQITDANGSIYSYTYDSAGNRTEEVSNTRDARGTKVHLITRHQYDSHNRLILTTQDDLSTGTSKRIFELRTDYDANGNRRRVQTQSGYGSSSAVTTISNQAPRVIGSPLAQSMTPGVAGEIRLLISDIFRDAEQDKLTGVSVTGLPVGLTAQWLSSDGQLRIQGTPGAALSGQTFTLTLTATDAAGLTAQTTLSLAIKTNSAPIARDVGDLIIIPPYPAHRTANWGALAYEIKANDVFQELDADDIISLTLTPNGAVPTWLIVTQVAPGDILLTSNKSFSDNTIYYYTLTATDRSGAVTIKNVSIDVRRPGYLANAPTAASLAVKNIVPGNDVLWQAALSTVISDIQVDGALVSATLLDGSPLPSWLQFQYTNDGMLRLSGSVPSSLAANSNTVIKFAVVDKFGASFNNALTLSATPNTAPTALQTSWAAPVARLNEPYIAELALNTLFSDAQGDAITINLQQDGIATAEWLSVTVDQLTGMVRLFGTPTSVTQLGAMSIQLRARDTNNAASTIALTLSVLDHAPVRNAGITLPARSVQQQRSFNFNFVDTLFTDVDGDALTYSAKLSSGAALPTWLVFNPSTRTFSGIVPAGQALGNLRIVVQATDGRNVVGDNTISGFDFNVLAFANSAPARNAGIVVNNQSTREGDAVYITFPTNAFTDADGDAIASYRGEIQIGASWLTFPQVGLNFNSTTGLVSGAVIMPTQSSYNLRIYARDDFNAESTTPASFSLAVNRKPTVPASQSVTVVEGIGFSHTIAGYSDPESGALTYTATKTDGSALPAWLSISAAGVVTGTPPAGFTGMGLSIKVTDNVGLISYGTLSLNASNPPPAYVGGSIPTNFALLGNVGWSYQIPSTAFTNLPVAELLSYSITVNGSATLPAWLSFNAGTRTLSGTPPIGTNISIAVYCTDTAGGVAGTSFTLSASNAVPVYNGGFSNRAVVANDPVNWAHAANFSDANNEALSYRAWIERPAYSYEVLIPGTELEPMYNIVNVAAAWLEMPVGGLSINASTGVVTGSPTDLIGTNYYFSSYRLLVRAADSQNATVDGIYTVSLTHRPSVTGVTSAAVTARQPVNQSLLVFTDADGGALTHTVSGLPAGLSLSSAGVLSGTAPTAGIYSFTVTATDNTGLATSTSYTLTALNYGPYAVQAVPNQSATQNTAFSYQIPANAFADANGDILSYSATGLPAGLSISASGLISGTPTTVANNTITLTVNDGYGASNSTTFSINVIAVVVGNVAPTVLNPLQDQQVGAGSYFSYQIPINTFADANGDTLTYTATGMAAWLSFNASTRTFSGTSNSPLNDSPRSITVTANDGRGGTVSNAFILTVLGTGGGQVPLVAQPVLAVASFASSIGPSATPLPSTTTQAAASTLAQDIWYTYDAENQVKIGNGLLVGQQIMLNPSNTLRGYAVNYDAVGRQLSIIDARFNSTSNQTETWLTQMQYDARGHQVMDFDAVNISVAQSPSRIAKGSSYDVLGRLTETRAYYAPRTIRTTRNATAGGREPREWMYVEGYLSRAEQYSYDGDGRVVQQRSLGRTSFTWALGLDKRIETGVTTVAQQKTDLSVLGVLSQVDYVNPSNQSGYDAAGRVGAYRYSQFSQWEAQAPEAFVHDYAMTYEGRDSYLEKTVIGTSLTTNYRTTTNTLTYDAQGHLLAQRESTPIPSKWGTLDDRVRFYAYDGEGHVVGRRDGRIVASNNSFDQGTAANKENYRFVVAMNSQLANLQEGGPVNFSGAAVTPALTGYASGGTTKVTVQAGDTLRTLAERVYGHESYWYVLADANGLLDAGEALATGTQLNAPEINVSKNDASTFKPYDPSSAIGGTTPSLPYITPPPRGDNCAKIFMIVIAIVVTVVTYGQAAPYLSGLLAPAATLATTTGIATAGAIAGGFVAGVAGSIASQAVGSALGVTSFSLRSAVSNGIAGGLTAGLGAALGGSTAQLLQGGWSNAGRVAVSAVGTAAAGYVGNKIAGVSDTHFSWKSIASGAVSSVITAGIGKGLGFKAPKLFEGSGSIGGDFVMSAAGGVVSGHVRQAFGFKDAIDYQQIALDAFGNALGNVLGGVINKSLENRAERLAAKPQSRAQITRTEIEPVGLSDVDDLITELGARNKPMLSTEDRLGMTEADLKQRLLGIRKLSDINAQKAYKQWDTDYAKFKVEQANYYEPVSDLGIISGTGPDGVAPAQGRSFFGDVANAAGRGWNIAQSVASWRWNTVTSDYNQLANWTNNASDKIWNAYQQSSIGQALQGTGFMRWAENQRVRLPTYTTAGNAWQGTRATALPLTTRWGEQGERGSWYEFGLGWQRTAMNMGIGIVGNSSLGVLYQVATGNQVPQLQLTNRMLGGGAAFEQTSAVLATVAPFLRAGAAPATASKIAAADTAIDMTKLQYQYVPKAGANSGRQTGARQVINPESSRAYDLAEGAYDVTRADVTDISSIAKNTGWRESRVSRIKDHIFYKDHLLDSGMRRFDADPDMLNAWNRLSKGDFMKSDIDLLRHEIFESKFEGIYKTNYRQAHDAAIRAGRTWTPE